MNKYYFTFGCGTPNKGKCQVIEASCELFARAKMFEIYGSHFCTSYGEEQWNEMKNNPNRPYELEHELPDIIIVSDEEAQMLIDNGVFDNR